MRLIASRSKDEDTKTPSEILPAIDKNQDGTLTLVEIKSGAGQLKLKLDIHEWFSHNDTDGPGVVNYTEFIAATIDQKVNLREEILYEAFKAFD